MRNVDLILQNEASENLKDFMSFYPQILAMAEENKISVKSIMISSFGLIDSDNFKSIDVIIDEIKKTFPVDVLNGVENSYSLLDKEIE